MGVPALYKWLCNKYPKIVEPLKNSTTLDDDSYGLNDVNGFDVDNFYIDTNGLIHPVCHPQGVEPPETEEEMYELIIKLLKRLIFMIHPKNLIYIAIDGVAPRAKMNQQRIRRANAARDAEIEEKVYEEISKEMNEKGLNIGIKHNKRKWDSNSITPGTKFMSNLNIRIKEFIKNDLMKNEKLKNVKILFSGSEVNGEGEHKIMNFIRQQRLYPSYNANTSHCIYGLDADLILLSLATHEVNMKILRENNNSSLNNMNNIIEYKNINDIIYKSLYEILNISTLREYLGRIEFSITEFVNLKFELNFEHVLDDLIFLLMFVGNDFLPHIPSLNIREGAIDVMILYYKRNLNELGGYLMENNKCIFSRISKYLKELCKIEPIIFKLRKENEKSYEEYISNKNKMEEEKCGNESMKRKYNESNNENDSNTKRYKKMIILNDGGYNDEENYRSSKILRKELFNEEEIIEEEEEKEKGEEKEKEKDVNNEIEEKEKDVENKEKKEKEKEVNKEVIISKIKEKCYNEKKLIYEDKIHLEEDGYKERYYKIKFELNDDIDINEFSKKVSMEYMKGIEWIISYYYEGCISWSWYYPYHYPPFLSDLCLIDEFNNEFELNRPFNSNEQLMSVLPSYSSDLVPKCYKDLMTNPKSPIIEFYKNDFKIDPNGAYQPWLYISLLPPIDEELLLKTLKSKENELSEEEKVRNKVDEIKLYISSENGYKDIILKYLEKEEYVLIPDIGLNGLIKIIDNDNDNNDSNKNNKNCLEMNYKLEEPYRKHISNLLNKAILPKMKLNEDDVVCNIYNKKGIIYKYILEHLC